MIAYISIGNSDDKLTQREWAAFWLRVDSLLRRWADAVHGAWLSQPSDRYQNACWCIEIEAPAAESVKATLRRVAAEFTQDSIVWAPAQTEFIRPPDE